MTSDEQKKRRNAACMRWQKRNKGKVAAYARKYRATNITARLKHREHTKTWRINNPEKYKEQLKRSAAAYRADPSKHRAYLLVTKYGVTLDDYFAMMASQDGKCKLCREPFGESKGKRPALDHCHETGNVRGILHANCNIALGMLRDSPAMCIQAAEYLRAHQSDSQNQILKVKVLQMA